MPNSIVMLFSPASPHYYSNSSSPAPGPAESINFAGCVQWAHIPEGSVSAVPSAAGTSRDWSLLDFRFGCRRGARSEGDSISLGQVLHPLAVEGSRLFQAVLTERELVESARPVVFEHDLHARILQLPIIWDKKHLPRTILPFNHLIRWFSI